MSVPFHTRINCTIRAAGWWIAETWLIVNGAAAQTLGQAPDDGISWWRIVLALAVCLVLAAILPFAVKYRFGERLPFLLHGRSRRRLRVVDSVRLSHQASLSIVECDGEELLVSVSNGSVVLLKALPARPRSTIAGGLE